MTEDIFHIILLTYILKKNELPALVVSDIIKWINGIFYSHY